MDLYSGMTVPSSDSDEDYDAYCEQPAQSDLNLFRFWRIFASCVLRLDSLDDIANDIKITM